MSSVPLPPNRTDQSFKSSAQPLATSPPRFKNLSRPARLTTAKRMISRSSQFCVYCRLMIGLTLDTNFVRADLNNHCAGTRQIFTLATFCRRFYWPRLTWSCHGIEYAGPQSFQVIGTPLCDLRTHYAGTGLPQGVYLRWERMLIGIGIARADGDDCRWDFDCLRVEPLQIARNCRM